MKRMSHVLGLLAATLLAGTAWAKLPPPSEEAKAKAADAAAKAAHADKVANYQLCKSREKVAAQYFKTAKAAGKETHAPMETPPCVDPGPYVAGPPAGAASAPAAPAPAGKKS